MKRMVLSVIVASLLGNAALAGETASRGPASRGLASRGLTFGEFMCGIAGAATLGYVSRSAGANDFFTFVGSLVGGAIGVNICQELERRNTIGYKTLSQSLNVLNGPMCSTQKWIGPDYNGYLTVLSSDSGQSTDIGTCRVFEMVAYDNVGRYILNKYHASACKNSYGEWQIEELSNRQQRNQVRCAGTADGDLSNGGSSQGVEVPLQKYIQNWDYSYVNLQRIVGGVYNGLAARRDGFPFDVEVGMFKALSQDRQGAIIFESREVNRVLSIHEVGIECGLPGSPCASIVVLSENGRCGTLKYMFRNGDVVINDLRKGLKLSAGRLQQVDERVCSNRR